MSLAPRSRLAIAELTRHPPSRCPGKECTTKGTRPAIHDHQQGCESLHRKLSRVSEELEHVEEEHRAKAAKHAEQVDELQDELENCQYEVSALEEAQEQTSGDLYTVARRLRTLEEHVGLQYTVDVDDDDGTAILLLNEAFDVHQPAPLALDVLVPFAQPPAVAGAVHAGAPDDAYENFDLDFDTRAIANPSKSQQKLRQRLVASLKAAKLAEKAAESSEMEVDEDEAPLEAQLGAGAMQVRQDTPWTPIRWAELTFRVIPGRRRAQSPSLQARPHLARRHGGAATAASQGSFLARGDVGRGGQEAHCRGGAVLARRLGAGLQLSEIGKRPLRGSEGRGDMSVAYDLCLRLA